MTRVDPGDAAKEVGQRLPRDPDGDPRRIGATVAEAM